MSEADDLQQLAARILAGNYSLADIDSLRAAVQGGSLAAATGERSVAVDGDAQRAVIIIGDNNIVFPPGATELFAATLPARASAVTAPTFDLVELKEVFREASASLSVWPKTLGNGVSLPRTEADEILKSVRSDDSSTTVLLGVPGSGKSALLASLAQIAIADRLAVLAIKADELCPEINSAAKLAEKLGLPGHPAACIRSLASQGKVLVLLDQLDALSDLVDLRSGRLNVLLGLVKELSGQHNVHIVCSCRTIEYRHDVRLTTLDAQPMQLKLPAWPQIVEVLRDHGIQADRWSDAVREPLRVPQHLKLFLQHWQDRSAGDVFTSYQGMLDALWDLKVTNADGLAGRAEFLMRMAEIMGTEETFWLPVARFEDQQGIIAYLEKEGILFRGNRASRIGFQHQTLMEHARARAFARGIGRLATYVIERQDALFVRPTLWATLNYLRETSESSYRRELEQILRQSPRRHVQQLIIDFLGQVAEPSDFEERLLVGYLANPVHRNRALGVIRGSKAWFGRLATSTLPALMNSPPDACWAVIGVIREAWQFARRRCLDLIRNYWLPDQARDRLTLSAFSELIEWDDESVSIVCDVARRSRFGGPIIYMIARAIARKYPSLAAKVFAASWEGTLFGTERARSESTGLASENASHVEEMAESRVRSTLIEFLEKENAYELGEVAKAAPKAFLDALWPTYVRVIERICRPRHHILMAYRGADGSYDDLYEEGPQTVTSVMASSVRLLAKNSAAEFLTFLNEWRHVDAMVIQRILARGAMQVAGQHPGVVVAFLSEDARRLLLGDALDKDADTIDLIEAVGSYLTQSLANDLELAIHAFTEYWPGVHEREPESEPDRRKWDTKKQIPLLGACPRTLLSSGALAVLSETPAEVLSASKPRRRRAALELVKSPMSAVEMAAANDEEILGLFKRLTDGSATSSFRSFLHPLVEAAREFAEFAKKDARRGAALIRQFRPNDQETPVAYAMRPMGESDLPSEDLFDLIVELDERGFRGEEFRGEAAAACSARAKDPDGLPHRICMLLERWLKGPWSPVPAQNEESHRPNDEQRRPESVLWLPQRLVLVPQGAYQVLEALGRGYMLREPPETDRWLSVLEDHVEEPGDPETWSALTGQLQDLWLCEKERATNFLERLFTRFPSTRDSDLGAFLVARLRWFLPVEGTLELLHAIRDSKWDKGPQAYGEIIGLWALTGPDNQQVQDEVAQVLGEPSASAHAKATMLGLAFSCARFWLDPPSRSRATDLMVRLIQHADESIADAIMSSFVSNDKAFADDESRRVLEAILANETMLKVRADHWLVEYLEELVKFEPDLVHQVCSRVVSLHGSAIGDFRTSLATCASSITNIAITLQRLGTEFREKGLALFEDLIANGVPEAQATLLELDRRPVSLPAVVHGPRKRQRE